MAAKDLAVIIEEKPSFAPAVSAGKSAIVTIFASLQTCVAILDGVVVVAVEWFSIGHGYDLKIARHGTGRRARTNHLASLGVNLAYTHFFCYRVADVFSLMP